VLNPTSVHGLLSQAQRQLDADDFEAAIRTLNDAKEHHGSHPKVQELLQKAHTLLKHPSRRIITRFLAPPVTPMRGPSSVLIAS